MTRTGAPTLAPTEQMRDAREAVYSWSGGKDSLLALQRSLATGAHPRALATMLDETGRRSRSHGLSVEILDAQARSLGIPLITRATSWNDYETAFTDALAEAAGRGAETCVFGDIDIDAHRDWCHRVAASAGLRSFHPLWRDSRRRLIHEFLRLNYKAILVVVRLAALDRSFLGRELDDELLLEFEVAGIDPCGENGEFHTVVTSGPLFTEPLRLRPRGHLELEDAGCAALELTLDESA